MCDISKIPNAFAFLSFLVWNSITAVSPAIVPDQKFSAAPRPFVRVRTTDDAVAGGAINVHLLPASERKVAEMYAYARSAGALDD
jgi:hypothetical protein